jgi:hypothetical protein
MAEPTNFDFGFKAPELFEGNVCRNRFLQKPRVCSCVFISCPARILAGRRPVQISEVFMILLPDSRE